MGLLAISPHLDDAVVSAGATLSSWTAAGRSAHVWTIFAGEPRGEFSRTAQALHAGCGLGQDAIATRRVEDSMAVQRVGAHTVHGNLLDAVYRRGPNGAWLCRDILDVFARRRPDPELVSSATQVVLQTIDDIRPDVLLSARAIGHHVDHRVARQASERAARLRRLPLLLWEDQPYVAEGGIPGRDQAMHVAYTTQSLAAKLDAVSCYVSQLAMMWPDDDWREALAASGGTPNDPAGEWLHPNMRSIG